MKVNIKEIGLTIEDKLWNWRASHGGSEQDDMAVASRTYLWDQSRERPIPINEVFKHTQVHPVMPLIFLDLMYTELSLLRIIMECLGFVS